MLECYNLKLSLAESFSSSRPTNIDQFQSSILDGSNPSSIFYNG
jgi:hypothetical protein